MSGIIKCNPRWRPVILTVYFILLSWVVDSSPKTPDLQIFLGKNPKLSNFPALNPKIKCQNCRCARPTKLSAFAIDRTTCHFCRCYWLSSLSESLLASVSPIVIRKTSSKLRKAKSKCTSTTRLNTNIQTAVLVCRFIRLYITVY